MFYSLYCILAKGDNLNNLNMPVKDILMMDCQKNLNVMSVLSLTG